MALSKALGEGGEPQVRPAGPSDVPTILGFIRALADYERLSDEVKAEDADLARDLFAPAPRVFCDIVEVEGEPVGFALWFYTYSTFAGRHGIYLEDLFVETAARGRGAGLALVRGLAQRCAREGLARLEWAVLDWNRPALDFYDRLGARGPEGWLSRRLSGEALARLAKG